MKLTDDEKSLDPDEGTAMLMIVRFPCEPWADAVIALMRHRVRERTTSTPLPSLWEQARAYNELFANVRLGLKATGRSLKEWIAASNSEDEKVRDWSWSAVYSLEACEEPYTFKIEFREEFVCPVFFPRVLKFFRANGAEILDFVGAVANYSSGIETTGPMDIVLRADGVYELHNPEVFEDDPCDPPQIRKGGTVTEFEGW